VLEAFADPAAVTVVDAIAPPPKPPEEQSGPQPPP